MFRRKRFSEPAASIPWWPSEDPGRSSGYPGAPGGPGGYDPSHDPASFGPGAFGPGGPGAGGYSAGGYSANGPGGYGPNGPGPDGFGPSASGPGTYGPHGSGPGGRGAAGAPPLAAHDPFGGWPAFGDGYSDDFAGGRAGPDSVHGMPGPGHPANGWPLVEGWADEADGAHPADPFGAAAAFHPSTHPNGDPIGQQPANGRAANGHPVGFSADGRPAAGHPANGHPATGHPSDVFPIHGHAATDAPIGAAHAGAPVEAAALAADQSEGLPDWLPLLTHPIGGQRFQPDLEAAPDPAERPAPGRPPRRRNGRRPKARRQQGAPIDGAEADPTTWIPTIPAGAAPEQAAPARPGASTPAQPDGTTSARPDGTTPAKLDGTNPAHPDGTTPARPGATVTTPGPAPGALTSPDPAEASSLAGAFAADYLSWDQDNPTRRGQVLAQYLPTDIKGDPSLLGWSGKGRQRSEFSLPGAVHPDGEGRVLVDVRVRVTPFRQVGPADRVPAPSPEARLEVAGVPAVAPAPSARGWKSQDSHWVRLTVPVTREQGRLVVDTWDEQLGDDSDDSDDVPAAGSAPDRNDGDDPGTADDADDSSDDTPRDRAAGTDAA